MNDVVKLAEDPPVIKDAFDAWWFLQEHPKFFHPDRMEIGEMCGDFKSDCLDIDIQRVCPITKCIEADPTRNTLNQVWLECGPYVYDDGVVVTSHDCNLDCGGDTFEEAILQLAHLVIEWYGDYRSE